jgi:hypothetical protein
MNCATAPLGFPIKRAIDKARTRQVEAIDSALGLAS